MLGGIVITPCVIFLGCTFITDIVSALDFLLIDFHFFITVQITIWIIVDLFALIIIRCSLISINRLGDLLRDLQFLLRLEAAGAGTATLRAVLDLLSHKGDSFSTFGYSEAESIWEILGTVLSLGLTIKSLSLLVASFYTESRKAPTPT